MNVKNAVLLVVHFHRFGIRRKLSSEKVSTDADKSLVSVAKRILDCAEFNNIFNHDYGTMDMLGKRSIPMISFGNCTRAFAAEAVLDVNNLLIKRCAEREQLVEQFLDVYDERAGEARKRLADLAKPADYPPTAQVRAAFGIEWVWWQIGTPQGINAAVLDQTVRETRALWQRAMAEAVAMLRAELAKLVNHMVECLQPGEDGKPRRWQKSSLTNLQEWLELFSQRDLAQDNELAVIVTRLKRLSTGLDADVIKSNDALQQKLSVNLGKAGAELKKLVETAPSRKIALDWED
jgi:hypothetical protein